MAILWKSKENVTGIT